MLKKISIALFIILIVFILGIVKVFFDSTVKKLSSPIPTIPPFPSETQTESSKINEVTLRSKTYQFYFHKIKDNETLKLIPNFKEATFSAQIIKKYDCDFGVNGGFYKKEGGPLGLFFADQKILGEEIPSTTFNGFLSSSSLHPRTGGDPDFGLSISSTPPYDYSQIDFILQSGPLIFLKNNAQPSFTDHDFSRRHLIAKSTTGEFYLFSIFEKDNKFNGPRLEDLHAIFLSPDLKTIADFELVLNLDGGSASAFYDEDVQIEEFKPIGSFLCGKTQFAK